MIALTKSSTSVEPPSGTTEKSPPASLATSIYSQLRADVLTGRLQPEAKLRAETLRKRFNTGSTPIREALNRLFAEGFVSLEEQRGFRVAPISREELAELLNARILIDGTAVTDSIRRFDPSWEDGLVLALHHLSRTPRVVEATNGASWEARHKVFHMALVAGCGSRWMQRISEQLFDSAERYRLIALPWIPERNELDEHRTLVEACMRKDAAMAVELLKSHYGQTFNAIVSSGRV